MLANIFLTISIVALILIPGVVGLLIGMWVDSKRKKSTEQSVYIEHIDSAKHQRIAPEE